MENGRFPIAESVGKEPVSGMERTLPVRMHIQGFFWAISPADGSHVLSNLAPQASVEPEALQAFKR